MKLNFFAAILLMLGLNVSIIAGDGGNNTSGSDYCHDTFVSSEFSE